MTKTKMDECFMQLAIDLAEKGRGFVSPNPMVGAVIVKNRKIIAQGYHKKFGEAHAEINAFRNAKESVKDATLYVTLEPCNFLEKKTPPCVPAIVKAGIKKVVIGTLDCNLKTCNKGVSDLNKAGIKTKVGVLREDVEKQNEYYFKYTKTGLPYVTLKLGLTLDGRIATNTGISKWITSSDSQQFSQMLRKENDAILVGTGTILKDNPRLTCRIDKKKVLTRVILDAEQKIPLEVNVFNGKSPTLLFINKDTIKTIQLISKGVEIVKVKKDLAGLLSWSQILVELGKHNIASLLIEGGAQVASSALQAGIVDKVYLIYSPKILGQGISFSDHLKLNGLESSIKIKDYKIIPSAKDFIVEGYIDK